MKKLTNIMCLWLDLHACKATTQIRALPWVDPKYNHHAAKKAGGVRLLCRVNPRSHQPLHRAENAFGQRYTRMLDSSRLRFHRSSAVPL